jgi:hypothetical protein
MNWYLLSVQHMTLWFSHRTFFMISEKEVDRRARLQGRGQMGLGILELCMTWGRHRVSLTIPENREQQSSCDGCEETKLIDKLTNN